MYFFRRFCRSFRTCRKIKRGCEEKESGFSIVFFIRVAGFFFVIFFYDGVEFVCFCSYYIFWG